MKKVISDKELKNKMKEAINLLCKTVKTTLGPKGNNIIIDHSTFSPFITNDGVTIAENIESEDPVINTILELAKESSIKTNEIVGDGTTTTLVLLETIFNKGLELIETGINPIIIKRELDLSLKNIITKIMSKSRKPKLLELEYIASISANDESIGKLVTQVYRKVNNKSAINIIESENDETKIIFNKGYTFDTMLASPYFLKNNEINLNNPYLLLINDYLNNINQLSNILNIILKENKHLIIIAKDYSDDLINELVSMYLDNDIKVILLKAPLYGIKQISFFEDINTIMKDNQINDANFITINNLNTIKNIKINNEKTTIDFDNNESIKKHIKLLESNLKNSDAINYLEERIAMFKTGTAQIIVGAPTKLERREMKMRIDDALCAVNSCKNGVLPGSGLILYEISDNLNTNTIGNILLKEALTKPLEQILINANIELSFIEQIKKLNYKKIYNLNTNDFEEINTTKILDPTLVVINSLKNACSIAGMLLTTSSLVINEYKNDLDKINDYSEI